MCHGSGITIGDSFGTHKVGAQIQIIPPFGMWNNHQLLSGVLENQIMIRWHRVEHAETECISIFAAIVLLSVGEEIHVCIYLSFIVTIAASCNDCIRFYFAQIAIFVIR